MDISLPWSRQQVVLLASLTRLDAMYQIMGEKAAPLVHLCCNTLREHAAAHGGRIYPSLAHQALIVFGSPRRAMDWIEQAPTLLMPLLANQPALSQPGLAIGIDCADTTELDGVLHTTALARVERLLWGRSADVVLADTALAILPDEVKSRLSRVAAPRELGPVWRIGVKEASVMATMTTQPIRITSAAQATTEAARPKLLLELLDRNIQLDGSDQPLVFGRNVPGGMEIPDPRVSRSHARIEPRGNHFAVVDSSSNGTWVKFQGQDLAVELRQQECKLHGRGVISFGVEPNDFSAPTVGFTVTMAGATGLSTMGNSGFGNAGFGYGTAGS